MNQPQKASRLHMTSEWYDLTFTDSQPYSISGLDGKFYFYVIDGGNPLIQASFIQRLSNERIMFAKLFREDVASVSQDSIFLKRNLSTGYTLRKGRAFAGWYDLADNFLSKRNL